jgi:NAD(P)H-flavin reductase
VDANRLKASFAQVAMHGDEVALYFYADLFLRAPAARDLFPVSMSAQRDRLVGALGRIVADVDNLDALVPFLQGLGRDHRKFGAIFDHYEVVGASLLATLAHFSGPAWTDELAAEWKAAYTLVAQVMTQAARDDEGTHPPWWDATVIAHERRSLETAVFRVQPGVRLDYVPGQSVALQAEDCPRIWRFYSIANSPRDNGTLDFHVRMIDGGALSPFLTWRAAPGCRLRLGPPTGTLTVRGIPERDIVMAAASTGLAPLKAIVEQLALLPAPPRVHLFYAARSAQGLYDLPSLEKLAAQYGWLKLTHAISQDLGDASYTGERGSITDVLARHGPWHDHDAYICGPTEMVAATAAQLSALGVPREQIRAEDLAWSQR